MKNAIVTITKININPTASIVNQVSTPPKPGAIQFAIDSAEKKQHMETIIHIARYFKTKGVIFFMSLFLLQITGGFEWYCNHWSECVSSVLFFLCEKPQFNESCSYFVIFSINPSSTSLNCFGSSIIRKCPKPCITTTCTP